MSGEWKEESTRTMNDVIEEGNESAAEFAGSLATPTRLCQYFLTNYDKAR